MIAHVYVYTLNSSEREPVMDECANEHFPVSGGGATTTSSEATSPQAKVGTSGQAGSKRKTAETDDKKKERKKQQIGNKVAVTPVAAARSNNQGKWQWQ